MANSQCSLCSDDRGPVINAMLAGGRSAHWIEQEMRRLGKPTKAETVRKHFNGCLNGDAANANLMPSHGAKGTGTNADFAAAVRREANRLLAEGKLTIRTADGLTAQALIDRRAEKQADRALMVEMARLLSGSRSDPSEVVVGEWKEVGGDDTDNTDADGLAPLALVAER